MKSTVYKVRRGVVQQGKLPAVETVSAEEFATFWRAAAETDLALVIDGDAALCGFKHMRAGDMTFRAATTAKARLRLPGARKLLPKEARLMLALVQADRAMTASEAFAHAIPGLAVPAPKSCVATMNKIRAATDCKLGREQWNSWVMRKPAGAAEPKYRLMPGAGARNLGAEDLTPRVLFAWTEQASASNGEGAENKPSESSERASTKVSTRGRTEQATNGADASPPKAPAARPRNHDPFSPPTYQQVTLEEPGYYHYTDPTTGCTVWIEAARVSHEFNEISLAIRARCPASQRPCEVAFEIASRGRALRARRSGLIRFWSEEGIAPSIGHSFRMDSSDISALLSCHWSANEAVLADLGQLDVVIAFASAAGSETIRVNDFDFEEA